MDVNVKFCLPDEDIPMRDCINGQRWRAVCINMEKYLEEQIRNTEDFDAVKGLELAQEKLYGLLDYFDLQTFLETSVDAEDK